MVELIEWRKAHSNNECRDWPCGIPVIQSNLYISLASGLEDPMLLERLCVCRGFV